MPGSFLPRLLQYVCMVTNALLGSAWFDSGHMTIAAIARSYADQAKVAALEVLLDQSSLSLQGRLGNLVTAATWMDKIKCRPDQVKSNFPACIGVDKPPQNMLLDMMHFVEWPYNKDGWEAVPTVFPSGQLNGQGGALWALSSASTVLSPGSGITDPASWDMSLRTMVHIFGDIHQPLHVAQLYSPKLLEDGDMGGMKIRLKSENVGPLLPMLHLLWDAAGGNGKDGDDAAWWMNHPPKIDAENSVVNADIEEVVKQVTVKYPPSYFIPERLDPYWNNAEAGCGISNLKPVNKFTSRLFTLFQDALVDTRQFAPEAYEEFLVQLRAQPSLEKLPVYTPSDDYIQTVREVSMKQIALAGYRVASALCYINSAEIPKPQSFPGNPSSINTEATSGSLHLTVLQAVCFLVIALFIGLASGALLRARFLAHRMPTCDSEVALASRPSPPDF